jgi:hypothetical protein
MLNRVSVSKRTPSPMQRRVRLLAGLTLALAAVACADDGKAPAEAGLDGALAAEAGAADASADARVNLDAEAGTEAGLDAAVEASVAVDGSVLADVVTVPAGDAAQDDAAQGGVGNPSIVIATARQVGRFGGDLRVDLGAARGANTVVALRVELLNGQTSLGSARTIPLPTLITALTGDTYVVIDGVFERYAELTTARLTLVDELDARSSPRDVSVTRQAVIGLGASCDGSNVLDRCAPGLGCKGSPATCQAGVAPVIARLGYFVDELGPRVVFEGSDPDADVVGYRMRFYDANDQLIFIDHDAEESSAPVSEVSGSIDANSSSDFFVRLTPSEVLVDSVASVRVNVLDSRDAPSEDKVAERMAATPLGLATTCDERTFNRCEGGSCADFGDQHRCALNSEAQAAACNTALVLNPLGGVTRVRGTLHSSLWDAPVGCSPAQKQGDRVVKLVLSDPASRVVLSTNHPYTGFDSVLYLLSSCSETPALERCSAPAATTASKAVLTLQSVAAGEYYVVVDSFPSMESPSDTFELTVSVE